MGQRFFNFIVVGLMACSTGLAHGQGQPKLGHTSTLFTHVRPVAPIGSGIQVHPAPALVRPAAWTGLYKIPLSSTLPQQQYTLQFGFFCRTELQIEKVTRVPFRFRLGSLAYSNYLEGK